MNEQTENSSREIIKQKEARIIPVSTRIRVRAFRQTLETRSASRLAGVDIRRQSTTWRVQDEKRISRSLTGFGQTVLP